GRAPARARRGQEGRLPALDGGTDGRRARAGDARSRDGRPRRPHRQLRRGRLRRAGRPDAARRAGARGRRRHAGARRDGRVTGPAIGVIGGSGLYELEGLTDVRWRRVRTPFGDPSDKFCTGELEGRRVVFLPRHGRGHRLTPTELNFRANVWGLKSLGVEWVVSVSAVGSMNYDVWHETHEAVSVEAVIANLGKNVATAKAVLRRVIPMIGGSRVCECPSLLQAAVITSPAAFPHGTRRRLDLLIGKYFPYDGRGRPASRTGHPRHKPASRPPLQ